MRVDKKTVEHIANLAMVALDEDEKIEIAREIDSILTWVQQLEQVDTGDTEPLTSLFVASAPFREDNPGSVPESDSLLSNAPECVQDYFSVPKVIEG